MIIKYLFHINYFIYFYNKIIFINNIYIIIKGWSINTKIRRGSKSSICISTISF